LGVELPRVKIEYGRRTVRPPSAVQQPPCRRIGQQTKIAAARSREIDPEQPDGGQRDFEHTRERRKRRARRAGSAVEIMLYRVDTGAVLETLLGQNCVRPFAVPPDRK